MSRFGGGSSSCSIFVGNIPYDAEEDELRELFSKAGPVASVRVVCDRETQVPKGYAFIDFGDESSVSAAIEKLSNVEYNGRKLRVDWAQRELRAGPGTGGGDDDRPELPPRRRGPPVMSDPQPIRPVPVITIADRLQALKDQDAAAKARVENAEKAERGEIGRLMETLTPQQVIHILGEMQRLSLRAPEVARALIAENMQLALALQHAQFLAGILDDAPLPTEPEVKERARNVRQKLWNTSAAPATLLPPPPGAMTQAGGLQPPPPLTQPGLMMVPGMQPPPPLVGMGGLPFGATAPQAFMPGAPAPPPMVFGQPAAPPMPAPQPMAAPQAPGTVPVGADLPQILALATDEASRKQVMDRLAELSPAEIDRLPEEHKVKLIAFLQSAPARQA